MGIERKHVDYAWGLAKALTINKKPLSPSQELMKSKVGKYAGWGAFALLNLPIVGEFFLTAAVPIIPEGIAIGEEGASGLLAYKVARPLARKLTDVCFRAANFHRDFKRTHTSLPVGGYHAAPYSPPTVLPPPPPQRVLPPPPPPGPSGRR